MSDRLGRLSGRGLRDRDELAVLARLILRGMLLRVLMAGRGAGLRQAVGDALHASAEHRQQQQEGYQLTHNTSVR